MKLLLTSDWHLKTRQPSYLETDIMELQAKKLRWLNDVSKAYGAKILVAGDLFENPYADQTFINWLFNHLPKKVYVIAGNHDLPVRNPMLGVERSVFTVFVRAGVFIDVYTGVDFGGVLVYGIPYFVDTVLEPEQGFFNILMVHRPVFQKQVPFWSKDGMTAREVLGIYSGWDLVLTGDIHKSFGKKTRDRRFLVNQGGLFYESEKDQDKFVYIFDTDTKEVEKILVPKIEEFTNEKIVEVDEKIVDLFVKYIEDETKDFKHLDYLKMLKDSLNIKGLEKGVKTIMMEVINEVNR